MNSLRRFAYTFLQINMKVDLLAQYEPTDQDLNLPPEMQTLLQEKFIEFRDELMF